MGERSHLRAVQQQHLEESRRSDDEDDYSGPVRWCQHCGQKIVKVGGEYLHKADRLFGCRGRHTVAEVRQ